MFILNVIKFNVIVWESKKLQFTGLRYPMNFLQLLISYKTWMLDNHLGLYYFV